MKLGIHQSFECSHKLSLLRCCDGDPYIEGNDCIIVYHCWVTCLNRKKSATTLTSTPGIAPGDYFSIVPNCCESSASCVNTVNVYEVGLYLIKMMVQIYLLQSPAIRNSNDNSEAVSDYLSFLIQRHATAPATTPEQEETKETQPI